MGTVHHYGEHIVVAPQKENVILLFFSEILVLY